MADCSKSCRAVVCTAVKSRPSTPPPSLKRLPPPGKEVVIKDAERHRTKETLRQVRLQLQFQYQEVRSAKLRQNMKKEQNIILISPAKPAAPAAPVELAAPHPVQPPGLAQAASILPEEKVTEQRKQSADRNKENTWLESKILQAPCISPEKQTAEQRDRLACVLLERWRATKQQAFRDQVDFADARAERQRLERASTTAGAPRRAGTSGEFDTVDEWFARLASPPARVRFARRHNGSRSRIRSRSRSIKSKHKISNRKIARPRYGGA